MNVKSYVSRLLGMAGEPIITPSQFRVTHDVQPIAPEPRQLRGANLEKIAAETERNLDVLRRTCELIEVEIARLNGELEKTALCHEAELSKSRALGEGRASNRQARLEEALETDLANDIAAELNQ
jgi:hypothetical protein